MKPLGYAIRAASGKSAAGKPRRNGSARCLLCRFTGGLIVGLVALLGAISPAPAEPLKVKLGQAVPTLGFLPLYAAEALDTFEPSGVAMEVVHIPGGDPTTLAALDAGDIDLAAVGADTALVAIAKGAPFEIVYSFMSKMSVDLTFSNAYLKRIGVQPSDPLETRLKALKGAIIGVSAVGGAQERIARWLAGRAGLDPAKDFNIALIGAPPALRAALENGAIDGFVLTAPEGFLAEQGGFGTVLLRPGAEIPELKSYYHLVLVAPRKTAEQNPAIVKLTIAAFNRAADATLADTKSVAVAIQRKFYPKADPAAILRSVESLTDGIASRGRMSAADMKFLLQFNVDTGAKGVDALDPA
ncbi:MAG: ABC transporter substrate-binding protein, partial [Roseiarcus sp.]